MATAKPGSAAAGGAGGIGAGRTAEGFPQRRKAQAQAQADQSSKGRAAGAERDCAGQKRPEDRGCAHDLALCERREGGGLCGDGALGYLNR